jgi:hypothetical protein
LALQRLAYQIPLKKRLFIHGENLRSTVHTQIKQVALYDRHFKINPSSNNCNNLLNKMWSSVLQVPQSCALSEHWSSFPSLSKCSLEKVLAFSLSVIYWSVLIGQSVRTTSRKTVEIINCINYKLTYLIFSYKYILKELWKLIKVQLCLFFSPIILYFKLSIDAFGNELTVYTIIQYSLKL